MRSVGLHFSTALNTTAAVTLEDCSGRGTIADNKARAVVLSHSGVGLVKLRTGAISKASKQWVKMIQSAMVSAAPGGRCDLIASTSQRAAAGRQSPAPMAQSRGIIP